MMKLSEDCTSVTGHEVGVEVSRRTVIRNICSNKRLRLRALRSMAEEGEGAGAEFGVGTGDFEVFERVGEVDTSGMADMLLWCKRFSLT